MAVETLTEFPSSFFAGDTLRVTIGNTDFPSSDWGLKVQLQSATFLKSFATEEGENEAFDLVITASDTAKIPPGLYVVSYVYTETAGGERKTDECSFTTAVYYNPVLPGAKTIARQTLEAMEAALLKMATSPRLSVNFNGQSFTNRNLKDFQDAIERQRAVVRLEDQSRTGHRRIARILHPL